MFNSIGPTELLIVLGIVLLIFGPKRLPGLGRQLGRGMREFKESVTGEKDEGDDEPTGLERPREDDATVAEAPAETPAASAQKPRT